MRPVDPAGFTETDDERPPLPVPVDWAVVEQWLGVRLPGEYQRLAERYGPVELGGYVQVHVPCADGDEYDWADWLRQARREARAVSCRSPTPSTATIWAGWPKGPVRTPGRWPSGPGTPGRGRR